MFKCQNLWDNIQKIDIGCNSDSTSFGFAVIQYSNFLSISCVKIISPSSTSLLSVNSLSLTDLINSATWFTSVLKIYCFHLKQLLLKHFTFVPYNVYPWNRQDNKYTWLFDALMFLFESTLKCIVKNLWSLGGKINLFMRLVSPVQ